MPERRAWTARVLAWTVLACSMLLGAGCMPDAVLIKLVSSEQELEEHELFRDGAWAADKIAIIDVEGLILNAPVPRLVGSGEHPVSLLTEQLDAARRDKRVRAVILRINSPGGAVTASELMHDEIRRFRQETGRPVVAVMMDVAASGGYYIACACDEIVAQRTTVTGSIGVIMQLFDLEGTLRKIGVTSNAITSGPHKDTGSPFRTMRPEERELLQGIVDDMHQRFVDVVEQGRPDLSRDDVLRLADGRVFTAPQAVEAGLVDRVATLRQTLGDLKKRVGSSSIRVVVYQRPLDYRPNYYARSPASPAGVQVNLLQLNAGGDFIPGTPQFMYLWAPGL